MIITRRKLKSFQIRMLVDEIKHLPDLNYVSHSCWKRYNKPYILSTETDFIGVCQVYEFNNWIKIGPFILFRKYHNQGYGKILLKKIFNDYKDKNIFIASSNPVLKHLLHKLNFKEVSSYFKLPIKIKLFLVKQIFEFFCLNYAAEFLRKKFIFKRNKFCFYIKKPNLLI